MILNKIKFIWPFFILTIFTLLLTYCLPTPHRYASGFLNPFQRLNSTNDEGGEESPESETPPVNDEEDEEEEITDEDGGIDETKIPYDLRMDTMAYMTCNIVDDDLFQFKIGAFRDGGIRLKSVFAKTYGDSISDIEQYPYHRASPFVAFTDGRITIKSWSNVPHFELTNPKLKHLDEELKTLLNRSLESLNNNESQSERSKFIDDDKPISATLVTSTNIRKSLHNYDLLVGFHKSGRSNEYLSYINSHNNKKYIHGRYYDLELDEKSNYVYVLDAVEESDPTNPTPTDWVCDYQYKILRNPKKAEHTGGHQHKEEHAHKHSEDDEYSNDFDHKHTHKDELFCPIVSRPESPGFEYLLVERVLKEEADDDNEWNINIEEKCISPKSTGNICYSDDVTRVKEDGCDTGKSPLQNNRCPHYLSICVLPTEESEEPNV